MAKQIYQTRNGVRVALTARDVKAYVMKERGWTSEQYNKEYDKLRNRLRAYEAFQRQSGVSVEVQSPASILYFESRARRREGAEYHPSLELQRIKSFPSISSGKALGRALERRSETFVRRYAETTSKVFAGLIAANPTAAEIGTIQRIVIEDGKRRIATSQDEARLQQYNELKASMARGEATGEEAALLQSLKIEIVDDYLITDPVKRERALIDLATKLHAKQDAAGSVQASSAIPFGQAVGSDEAIDFDIESYL